MKSIFTIFLLLFLSGLAAQQVSYTFNKQKILIGEPVELTMKAIIGDETSPPVFAIDTLPHFEVLARSKIDTVTTGGVMQLSQTLTITSWDSGRWPLPSVMVNSVPSKPVLIDVGYTSPWDPRQPYNDIKGIIPVAQPQKQTWWWYLIGAAVLIILFLLFFPAGKKESPEVVLDAAAYKKAMQALESLQKERVDPGQVKQYYTDLITIFRTYLKSGKGIQSFAKTTDDLSIQLQKVKMQEAERNGLLQTLRLSDLVKFAQYQPEVALNTEALNRIKQSITIIEQGHAV